MRRGRLGPRGRALLALALALVATLEARPSAAQESADAPARATARHLADEALEHFRAERWEEALRGFDDALKLARMPTIAVFSARCLARLGRLVEASERFRLAVSLPIDPSLTADQQEGQVKAKEEAQVERDALLPRIPRLTIEVRGGLGRGEMLRIGSVEVPSAQLGLARFIDPGSHAITLTREGHVFLQQEITIAEAEQRQILLEPPGSAPPAVAAPIAPPPPRRDPAPPRAPQTSGPEPLQVAGWVAVGTGAAALVVSAITYGAAADLDGRVLADPCSSGTCPNPVADDLATYEALRVTSLVTFFGGLAFGGAGVAMVLIGGQEAHPIAQASLTPGGARVRVLLP